MTQGWIALRHYCEELKWWLKTIGGERAEERQLEEPTRTKAKFETICVLSTCIYGWMLMCVCVPQEREEEGTQAACRAFTKIT